MKKPLLGNIGFRIAESGLGQARFVRNRETASLTIAGE